MGKHKDIIQEVAKIIDPNINSGIGDETINDFANVLKVHGNNSNEWGICKDLANIMQIINPHEFHNQDVLNQVNDINSEIVYKIIPSLVEKKGVSKQISNLDNLSEKIDRLVKHNNINSLGQIRDKLNTVNQHLRTHTIDLPQQEKAANKDSRNQSRKLEWLSKILNKVPSFGNNSKER